MRIILVLGLAAILVAGCVSSGAASLPPTARPSLDPAATPDPSQRALPSPISTPIAPGSSLSPSPSPEPFVSGWHVVSLPSQDRLYQLYGPAWTGEVFVVAGVLRGSSTGKNDGIRFWSSSDGETWSMADERSWGYVRDYAVDSGGHGVAVGYLGSAVAIWTSPDQRKWTKVTTPDAFEAAGVKELGSVTYGPRGFLALGDLPMLSPDGTSWTVTTPRSSGLVDFLSVATVGGRYTLLGTVDDQGTPRPRMWTSSDGLAWEEVRSIGDLGSTWPYPPEAVSLAAGPKGALLAELTLPGPRCRAWRSIDGLAWMPMDEPCPPGYVQATPWGFLLRSYERPGASTGGSDPTSPWACASGIWATLDGGHWECVASPVSWPIGGTTASDRFIILVDEPPFIPGEYRIYRGEIRAGTVP
jgi:hypothetical protein